MALDDALADGPDEVEAAPEGATATGVGVGVATAGLGGGGNVVELPDEDAYAEVATEHTVPARAPVLAPAPAPAPAPGPVPIPTRAAPRVDNIMLGLLLAMAWQRRRREGRRRNTGGELGSPASS